MFFIRFLIGPTKCGTLMAWNYFVFLSKINLCFWILLFAYFKYFLHHIRLLQKKFQKPLRTWEYLMKQWLIRVILRWGEEKKKNTFYNWLKGTYHLTLICYDGTNHFFLFLFVTDLKDLYLIFTLAKATASEAILSVRSICSKSKIDLSKKEHTFRR